MLYNNNSNPFGIKKIPPTTSVYYEYSDYSGEDIHVSGALLLETGGHILLETGGKILLEDATP